ncbi:hypothetical protein V8F33_010019 [Rhypophila sp. PSN 637]
MIMYSTLGASLASFLFWELSETSRSNEVYRYDLHSSEARLEGYNQQDTSVETLLDGIRSPGQRIKGSSHV